jgi:uncharacterized membrane protein YfcA
MKADFRMKNITTRLLLVTTVVFLVICPILGSSPHTTSCTDSNICKRDFDDHYTCHAKRKVCVRIPWEWNSEDIIGFVITFILLTYSSSGGTGSMTLLIPTYIVLFGFYSTDAFKLARYTNLVASLVNVFLNWNRYDPKKKMLSINYKTATVIVPLHLAGADFGMLLGNYLSPFACFMLLVLLLAKSLYDTWTRGMEERVKESLKSGKKDAELQADSQPDQKGVVGGNDSVTNEAKQEPGAVVLELEDRQQAILQELVVPSSSESGQKPKEDKDAWMKNGGKRIVYKPLTLNDDIRQEWSNIRLLFVSFFVVVTSAFLRGSDQTPSLIGLERCTLENWLVMGATHIALIWLSYIGYSRNKNTPKDILDKGDSYIIFVDQSYRWKILLAGFLSGTFSGIAGVGGGLLFSLYLLSLGFSLTATGSVTTLSVFGSSVNTSLQTYLGKGVSVEHTYLLLAISLVSSLIGYMVIKVWIAELNKQSIRIFMIFAVVALCSLILPYTTFQTMRQNPQMNFQFGDFC